MLGSEFLKVISFPRLFPLFAFDTPNTAPLLQHLFALQYAATLFLTLFTRWVNQPYLSYQTYLNH
jgi:hypothetical protein